jgi:DNA-binding Lrp family transcriptional regulator
VVSAGGIIGVDPVTLARRLERLESEGLAWVTGYASSKLAWPGAIVEIETQPGQLQDVAVLLAQDPEAVTIDITAGSRDLILTVLAPTSEAVYAYLLDRLETLDLIAKVYWHPISKLLKEASQWRLRALGNVKVNALRGLKGALAKATVRRMWMSWYVKSSSGTAGQPQAA